MEKRRARSTVPMVPWISRTSGNQQSVTDKDGLGNHGDKGIAVAGSGRADVADDVQAHFRSGSNFARLGRGSE